MMHCDNSALTAAFLSIAVSPGRSQPELLANVVKVRGQGSTELPDPGGNDAEQPSSKRARLSILDAHPMNMNADDACHSKVQKRPLKEDGTDQLTTNKQGTDEREKPLKGADSSKGLGCLLGDYDSSSSEASEGGIGCGDGDCEGHIEETGTKETLQRVGKGSEMLRLPDVCDLLGLGKTPREGEGEGVGKERHGGLDVRNRERLAGVRENSEDDEENDSDEK